MIDEQLARCGTIRVLTPLEASGLTTASDAEPERDALAFWRGVIVAIAFSVPAWGALIAFIWYWP